MRLLLPGLPGDLSDHTHLSSTELCSCMEYSCSSKEELPLCLFSWQNRENLSQLLFWNKNQQAFPAKGQQEISQVLWVTQSLSHSALVEPKNHSKQIAVVQKNFLQKQVVGLLWPAVEGAHPLLGTGSEPELKYIREHQKPELSPCAQSMPICCPKVVINCSLKTLLWSQVLWHRPKSGDWSQRSQILCKTAWITW